MTSAAVAAFCRDHLAAKLADIFGSTVVIDGRSFRAVVSTGEPELNLESGGFSQPVEFVVRIAKADAADAPFTNWKPSPPQTKGAISIEGRNYRIFSVRQNFTPLAQEWILEVGTP
jgi:hypothetical protein